MVGQTAEEGMRYSCCRGMGSNSCLGSVFAYQRDCHRELFDWGCSIDYGGAVVRLTGVVDC